MELVSLISTSAGDIFLQCSPSSECVLILQYRARLYADRSSKSNASFDSVSASDSSASTPTIGDVIVRGGNIKRAECSEIDSYGGAIVTNKRCHSYNRFDSKLKADYFHS